ncbi:His-Xaa-Ser system radical SAM maturase HxsB [Pacificispira sp.]|uniref:His-Xaa-Ser system radical SAM maturase HxsB n=1 Tax=Pacificispira sp. TaxID=2888761 RepID=UPI003B522F34
MAVSGTIRRRQISQALEVTADETGWLAVRETDEGASSSTIPYQGDALDSFARRYRASQRRTQHRELNYLILVPTLRCNLSCTYCQVSRVNEHATGFDWTDESLRDVLAFLDGLTTHHIKIEFQGGEPLLRPDLLEAIASFCRTRFSESSFVVCTNLQQLSEKAWSFISSDDVHVSTSLDGSQSTHRRQRTKNESATDLFWSNLRTVQDRFGNDKVSALPTVDFLNPPSYQDIVEAFDEFGLKQIYLRPINYQGFARKVHSDVRERSSQWLRYYLGFIDFLIARNAEHGQAVYEEYYFSHCLKRVLSPGHDGHVDLRNPARLGEDYLVIDYDGTVYPTDEARMVTRSGVIDLSIGHITGRLDRDKLSTLNQYASNEMFEACNRCTYQAFCGVDLIDDLSRYGTIHHPKHETWFCQTHIAIFDRIAELLKSEDRATRMTMSAWAGAFDPASRLV